MGLCSRVLQNQKVDGFFMQVANSKFEGSNAKRNVLTAEGSSCYGDYLVYGLVSRGWEVELTAESPGDKVP